MKILLIEDDQGIQETVELVFKITMSDVEFVGAREGMAGLELARMIQPDIIILDLGLPDISGFEVIRNIRENETTPIIIMTARSEPSTKQLCMELGANDFISKPFRRNDIVASVKGILSRENSSSVPVQLCVSVNQE